ncbi:MFS transporter [Comamonas testosteroni]|uniref:MFS transporter n=1 Tax=Comamonas testosteroni TaxID=285 RepID=A0A373FSI0_COMTE|nr:MFS transporter [Comamonas testosteroni]RGE47106.1 MFS transporter [Comamonas testosteroni]
MKEANQSQSAWKIVTLLLLANMLNIYDRTLPAIVVEPIRREWGLSDTQFGLVGAAFTVAYALTVIPLGRWSDTASRKIIMGVGLLVWSLFTGFTGLAWSYAAFFVIRICVGIGEATFGPASTSLIGDLFPSEKRSLPMGIFMLGLPLGSLLAFFTTGPIVQYFGNWRAPFYIAVVPGVLLALLMLFIKEPARGAADGAQEKSQPVAKPIRKVLSSWTMRWLVVAGIFASMAAYAAGSFLVPLIQRYFGASLTTAAVMTGVIIGMSGLLGLTAGGAVADRMHRIHPKARLIFGASSMMLAAVLTALALRYEQGGLLIFTALFCLGWLLQYNFYTCVYPAMQDVVEPRLRATAYAVYTALLYILGGGMGPVLVGALSDHYTQVAMLAAHTNELTDQLKGVGLHGAMMVVPATLFLSGVAIWIANRSFVADAQKMRAAL